MIATAHLFATLNNQLIELLKSLTPEDWNKPTLAKQWTVKDIAAHLLDTNVRTLAERDGHVNNPNVAINSYQDLVAYLNALNADWVNAAKRISPAVLTDMLEQTGREHAVYIQTLDLYIEAPYSVAWAGEEHSAMWFHVAREFTEKWHHQQQIREAVGKPGIMTRELFYPCIDTFLRGLPFTYRDTAARTGAVIKITIDTEIGGDWFLSYNGKSWDLTQTAKPGIAATIVIPPNVSWKLFTKGITRAEAEQKVKFSGDERLAGVVLNLLAVIA